MIESGPVKSGLPCAIALALFRLVVFLDEDAVGGAVEILELARAHGPEEYAQASQAHQQGNRDEEGKTAHRAARASRSELATTTRELVDIARAAISGVTSPASASGTASRL